MSGRAAAVQAVPSALFGQRINTAKRSEVQAESGIVSHWLVLLGVALLVCVFVCVFQLLGTVLATLSLCCLLFVF